MGRPTPPEGLDSLQLIAWDRIMDATHARGVYDAAVGFWYPMFAANLAAWWRAAAKADRTRNAEDRREAEEWRRELREWVAKAILLDERRVPLTSLGPNGSDVDLERLFGARPLEADS
jgi:hypothetical protein